MTYTLVLLRHGQSTWNRLNLFTGWADVPLSDQGVEEARAAGPMLVEAGLLPDVVHTSLQRRAINTANLTLDAANRAWIPVRRSWRLNERHYGALQGQDKKEASARYGADQVKVWRRSYDVPPEPVDRASEYHPANDPRYADIDPALLPASECLRDVLGRMLPYWEEAIVPDLRAGHTVLVSAHGNSLRALVKHLDGIPDADITELEIPTGRPFVYELDHDLAPLVPGGRYLGNAASARAAAEAVGRQAG
jgi:2,3-bisphosphoglycerate-dependent phosphoglycerate mutase